MEDRLSVTADELHRPVAPDGLAHRARVEFGQLEIQARNVRRVGGAVGDPEDGRADRSRVRRGREADRLHPRAPNLHDGDIDAIERGAAHHSGDSHDRFNSFCNSLSSCSASMGRSSSRFKPRMRSAMP